MSLPVLNNIKMTLKVEKTEDSSTVTALDFGTITEANVHGYTLDNIQLIAGAANVQLELGGLTLITHVFITASVPLVFSLTNYESIFSPGSVLITTGDADDVVGTNTNFQAGDVDKPIAIQTDPGDVTSGDPAFELNIIQSRASATSINLLYPSALTQNTSYSYLLLDTGVSGGLPGTGAPITTEAEDIYTQYLVLNKCLLTDTIVITNPHNFAVQLNGFVAGL